MARDDWFRRTSWSTGESQDFFAKLARSRSDFHKAQYLRIQALSLAQTKRGPLVRAALDLLRRLFTDVPDGSQLASAHLQAAHCHERLGDIPQAVTHFRLSLEAQSRYPNSDPGTALEFPWFIVEHELSDLYDEALQTLQAAHLAFPVQFFMAAAVRAFIAKSRSEHQNASRHAREALEAAGLTQSQFPYHRSLGIVGKEYQPIVARLSKFAAAG
jgi:tetratricopeptide (TPR) repeat protein